MKEINWGLITLFLGACTDLQRVPQPINEGQKLAFTRNKGNCLACHVIEGGNLPGNLGPELKNIRQHFKTKTQLRQFIWNAGRFNAQTIMPPFGKNKILNEVEIDTISDYIWTL